MMAWMADPQAWAALFTLTVLEIVLGIDNLIFIAIVTSRLPKERQPMARRLGLAMALITRLALLASVAWIASLTTVIFEAFGHGFTWRDLILIAGGFYLVFSGTREMHSHIEGEEHGEKPTGKAAGLAGVIAQIMLLDMVFSLDSIITAIGMTSQIEVMFVAVILAVAVMLVASNPVAEFINAHPSVKTLALSFLLLIGTMLISDGFGFHMPRSMVYAAIGFSLAVEAVNLIAAGRRKRKTKGPDTGH